jgi:predicted DNA-binding transcriptional regulator AlpA
MATSSHTERPVPTRQEPVPESFRLLNCDDVADMLGMNSRTVRRMALAGRFPRVELGHRTIRFRLVDVLDFIEASTTDERPEATTPGARTTLGVGGARDGAD